MLSHRLATIFWTIKIVKCSWKAASHVIYYYKQCQAYEVLVQSWDSPYLEHRKCWLTKSWNIQSLPSLGWGRDCREARRPGEPWRGVASPPSPTPHPSRSPVPHLGLWLPPLLPQKPWGSRRAPKTPARRRGTVEKSGMAAGSGPPPAETLASQGGHRAMVGSSGGLTASPADPRPRASWAAEAQPRRIQVERAGPVWGRSGLPARGWEGRSVGGAEPGGRRKRERGNG